MPIHVAVLIWIGANAPVLLLAPLVVGALVPSVASVSEAALPIAAFLMMFGSLVAAGLAPYERRNDGLQLGLLIIIVAVGPGLATGLAVEMLNLTGDLSFSSSCRLQAPRRQARLTTHWLPS